MRKSPAIWLLALMLLVAMVMVLNFSACAKQTESYTAPYTIERPDGTVYTVTPSDDTAGTCLLYTSPSPRDRQKSRMPSSA